MTIPPLTKSLTWAPPLSDSLEPRGMDRLCHSPDDLFRHVRNLSKSVKITGTRALAHGGYSDIWRGICWDGDVTQDVAIKMIRVAARRDVTTERLKTRISREVITWSQAQHKNIMPFYGLYWRSDDASDDLPAMVYPYCAAGTCTEYLRHNPSANRLNIICQVADGLIYLHSLPKPVVHGDIKACNILMKDDGTPMLADFGLSRIVAEVSTGLTTSSSRGSYRWMAPELFGGVEDQIQVLVTTASDVWAFGCLCVEILTDALPWASIKHDTHVMKAIAIDHRQPSLGCNVEPIALEHILKHCWLYEATKRPTMGDLLAALVGSDASPLHQPYCALDPTAFLSESPPQVLNGDFDDFPEEFSDNPLFSSKSNQTKTPLAKAYRPEASLFAPTLSVPCPATPAPTTPSLSDATVPSSGLASRDEPSLFDPQPRPSLATLQGPDRPLKKSREARLSMTSSMWPRTPSSGSSTLPAPEPQETAFRSDLWRSDPSTPSSAHTRSSSQASFRTPPRTESFHAQSAGPRPSPLSPRTTEGYASDRSTVSSSQRTAVTPSTYYYRQQAESDPRRQRYPNLNIPPSPSPSSQSSSHSRSPSHGPQSNYGYYPTSPARHGTWSPSATPRDYFRPPTSTAIRITKPDGTPISFGSPVKERRHL
ncbi:Tyrosine kinase domain protein [Ceratobasidium sp. AG-Ba]|nr:Tyrosine kinase domain protein [Ceratobasidium sp. AG-Ba]